MTPTRDEIQSLLGQTGPCASLYVPYHPGNHELRADLLRLKNELREAERKLAALGVRPDDARAWLRPAAGLVEDVGFWQQPGQGVAVFVSAAGMRTYRLPYPVRECAVVARRFHCKPLIKGLEHNLHFFILALSLDQVKLYRCTMYECEPVDLPDLPKGFRDFMKDYAPTPSPDPRAGTTGPQGIPTGKDQLLQYFYRVDESVHRVLRDETAPLVLAGVVHELPMYRQATRYRHVVDGEVTGSPDRMALGNLLQEARAIVGKRYEDVRRMEADRFNQFNGTGKASAGFREVVAAAVQGRVNNLFAKDNVTRWGTFDPATGELTTHDQQQSGDDDLIDLAVGHAFQQGGRVFIDPETPGQADLAADFRY